MKRKYVVILLLSIIAPISYAQNRPHIDDKPVHFGFSLGLNFMHFTVDESLLPLDGEIYHARVKDMLPGFSVGFITDVRLSRHLNFRCTPTLHFGMRTLTYKTESGSISNLKTDVLSLPITVPIYLKWSAEREVNYRPYLIGGGGVSFDFGTDKKRPILQKAFDYFVEVGFGCDFYFPWFKLCPQLTYSIGFNNVLTPVSQRPELPLQDEYYTNALNKLLNRQLTLTFNFE